MTDGLRHLWPFLDARDALLGPLQLAAWPAEFFAAITRHKYLVTAELSPLAVCPECLDHEEELISQSGPNGASRFFVACPEHLRVEVQERDRQRWRIGAESIAMSVSRSLGLAGQFTELVPGRLWRLGRASMRGFSRELMFARGLTWADGASVRARIVRGTKPVVFVAREAPPLVFWRGKPVPVLSLADLAIVTEQGIEVDPLAVHSAILGEEDSVADSAGAVVTEERLRTVVRRQIKAERQTELTDAVFVEAYRQTGSYRKAAELLTERTDQTVSKDQVSRAVKRSGGPEAAASTSRSDSVVRAGSALRDRRGKPMPSATGGGPLS